jgi:hypothetical protein
MHSFFDCENKQETNLNRRKRRERRYNNLSSPRFLLFNSVFCYVLQAIRRANRNAISMACS